MNDSIVEIVPADIRKPGWRRGRDIPESEQFGWWQHGDHKDSPNPLNLASDKSDEGFAPDCWYRPMPVGEMSDEVIHPLPELPEIVHMLPDEFVGIAQDASGFWHAFNGKCRKHLWLEVWKGLGDTARVHMNSLFQLPTWPDWKDSEHIRVDGRFVHHSQVNQG